MDCDISMKKRKEKKRKEIQIPIPIQIPGKTTKIKSLSWTHHDGFFSFFVLFVISVTFSFFGFFLLIFLFLFSFTFSYFLLSIFPLFPSLPFFTLSLPFFTHPHLLPSTFSSHLHSLLLFFPFPFFFFFSSSSSWNNLRNFSLPFTPQDCFWGAYPFWRSRCREDRYWICWAAFLWSSNYRREKKAVEFVRFSWIFSLSLPPSL